MYVSNEKLNKSLKEIEPKLREVVVVPETNAVIGITFQNTYYHATGPWGCFCFKQLEAQCGVLFLYTISINLTDAKLREKLWSLLAPLVLRIAQDAGYSYIFATINSDQAWLEPTLKEVGFKELWSGKNRRSHKNIKGWLCDVPAPVL